MAGRGIRSPYGGPYGRARSLATSPHGQDTEQQPDSNDSRHHQYMLIHSIDKDSDHTAGNGERTRSHEDPISSNKDRHRDMLAKIHSRREVLRCVPIFHKATHKRPQSRKKGGKDGQGRKRRSGEEKTVRGGEEKAVRGGKPRRGGKLQRKCPLVQQTPALYCGRCPCLWSDEHVLVLLAVD